MIKLYANFQVYRVKWQVQTTLDLHLPLNLLPYGAITIGLSTNHNFFAVNEVKTENCAGNLAIKNIGNFAKIADMKAASNSIKYL